MRQPIANLLIHCGPDAGTPAGWMRTWLLLTLLLTIGIEAVGAERLRDAVSRVLERAAAGKISDVHWIDRDGLIDHHDGHISFLDVVYFTMISVTTTGFGDIAPISDRSRLIEAVIVTPIRIAVLFIFVGTAYNFVLKRTWEKWRMARIQSRLTNHIVVLG